jgi:hypothetical protein
MMFIAAAASIAVSRGPLNCKHFAAFNSSIDTACSQLPLLQILAEKNIKHTSKYVDLFNGQSLSPEYLAVNPTGTVPALKDGDKLIGDSK